MPHAQIRTSYDLGPEGRILITTLGDDPAAGEEMSITVPGRAVWEVYAIRFQLTVTGTGTSRRVRLVLDDGENIFYRVRGFNVQTINTTDEYEWFQGAGARGEVSGGHSVPLPTGLVMLPGWRLRTETQDLLAGDNFTAPVLYVRELPQRGLQVGQDALLSALRRLIGEEA